jgi:hypothetical protein
MMENRHMNAQMTITLARAQRAIAGVRNSAGTNHQIDLGEFDSKAGVAKAQRDFAVFAEIFEKYPGDVAELVELVIGGQMARAHAVAEKIGLTESNLQSKGGGLPWIIIGIAIGFLFFEQD